MTQNTFPKSQYVTKAEISLCRKFETTWPNHILMWKWIQNCLFFLLHMKLNYIDASIGHALWLSNRIWVGVLCTVSKIDPWNFLYTILREVTSVNTRILMAAASQVAQWQRICLPKQETWVQSLGREDPLEKEMAIDSSILAWEIQWTEEPGRLQSMALQKHHTW